MNDAQKLVGVPMEEPLGPEENSEEAGEKLSPSLSSSTEVRDNSYFSVINSFLPYTGIFYQKLIRLLISYLNFCHVKKYLHPKK